MKNQFRANLPHIAALIIFVLASMIYFLPQFQGKVLHESDIVIYKAAAKEAVDFEKETGSQTLWTNSMFGGMPTYLISAKQKNNLVKYVQKVTNLGISRPSGYFIRGMICFYILMLVLRINPWLGIVGSLAFAFATNNILLFDSGHMTKLNCIMSSPAVIAGVILVFRKNYLWGGALFGISLAMNVLANHPQMTYYLALVLGIYFIIQVYKAFKTKEWGHLGKATGILAITSLLALGCSASKLLTTYEYGKDTMRGEPILAPTGDDFNSSEIDGLAWEYAMQWSNGGLDLLSSYIPRAVGGGSQETLSSKSKTVKDLKRKGVNVRDGIPLPLYWGDLPFTSGPIYFGAVIFFLFFITIFTLKGKYKWWLLSAVLLTFAMSMGKNLEFFNRLMFDFFPMLNKFRTPNSVLSVTAILIPMLAMIGVSQMIKAENKVRLIKPLLIATGILGGLTLIVAFIGPSMFDMSSPGDARLAQNGIDVDAFLDDRGSVLRSSALRSLAFILLTFAVVYFFLKSKLSTSILIGAIAGLTLMDLLPVDMRYIAHGDFISQRKYDQTFSPRTVDNQILNDSNPHFRVHDMSIDSWNSSLTSYFHKTIGGNHAAKLQRYQDLISRHLGPGNQKVFNMLNTRYFIQPGNNGPTATLNPAALGNAWFVNNVIQVSSADEEISKLSDFDPAGDAIVHKEYSAYVEGLNPAKEGRITLTEYQPNYLKYESQTSSDQLAVFSEIWYGPDKGWQAYIDKKPVDHICANYALRAMKVPSGNHIVEFRFDPPVFKTGELISLICSLLLIGVLLALLVKYFLSKKGSEQQEHAKAKKKKGKKKSKP